MVSDEIWFGGRRNRYRQVRHGQTDTVVPSGGGGGAPKRRKLLWRLGAASSQFLLCFCWFLISPLPSICCERCYSSCSELPCGGGAETQLLTGHERLRIHAQTGGRRSHCPSILLCVHGCPRVLAVGYAWCARKRLFGGVSLCRRETLRSAHCGMPQPQAVVNTLWHFCHWTDTTSQ